MKRVTAVLLATLAALVLCTAAHAQNAPGGVRYLYLIRHGMYDRDTTVTDDRLGNGLNRLGHEQARLTGARLAKLPVKLTRIVTSDFRRAVETAADMAAMMRVPVERDSLIHECTPTTERPDIMRGEAPEEIALCESNLDSAWRKYVVPAGGSADVHEALVCHGNVIRWMVTRLLGNDPKRWLRMDIANGSLTVLAVRPNGVMQLVMYSDASHIPIAKQTWTGKGAGWGVTRAGMK